MFNFGDVASQLQMLRDAVRTVELEGCEVPDCPVDEMSHQELMNANAFAWLVVDQALEQGYTDEVIEEALIDYKAIFKALVDTDEGFRQRVLNRGVVIAAPDPKPFMDYAKGAISEL